MAEAAAERSAEMGAPGPTFEAWVAEERIALRLTPGRRRRELRGALALADHPLRPEVLPISPPWWMFVGPGRPLGRLEAAQLLGTEGEPFVREATTAVLLGELLAGEVRPRRALLGLGFPTKLVDRRLSEVQRAASRRRLILGGVAPGWLRRVGRRPVCLRCDRVTFGWAALDFAALDPAALDPAAPEDSHAEGDSIQSMHAAGLSDRRAADAAFRLAAVSLWIREAVRGRVEARSRLSEWVGAPAAEPSFVDVRIEAPPFVDTSVWLTSRQVSTRRARWLLQNLDGLSVGGASLRVVTAPAIRPGKKPPRRTKRREAERAIFSRVHAGVEWDEEGRYSATPEALAMEVARGARGVVVDGTTGIGCMAIAYARQRGVSHVVAVDADAQRLAMARHNAEIYGIGHRISFRHERLEHCLDALWADLLVVDPPWGGRAYNRHRVTLEDLDATRTGLPLTPIIAAWPGALLLKLPRSFDVATLPAGPWKLSLGVDRRGIVKMLWARRGRVRGGGGARRTR